MTVFQFLIATVDLTTGTVGVNTQSNHTLGTVPSNEFWVVVPNFRTRSNITLSALSGDPAFASSAAMALFVPGESVIVSAFRGSGGTVNAAFVFTLASANGTLPVDGSIISTPARGVSGAGYTVDGTTLTFRVYKFSTAL